MLDYTFWSLTDDILCGRVTGEGVRVPVDTSKLVDLGFRYRYGAEETLDLTVACAKRLGDL